MANVHSNTLTANNLVPQSVPMMTHPLVADMYVKKEYGRSQPYKAKDVLVIEASFSPATSNHHEYRALMAELFMALPDIRQQVEGSVGTFDRVDIKTH